MYWASSACSEVTEHYEARNQPALVSVMNLISLHQTLRISQKSSVQTSVVFRKTAARTNVISREGPYHSCLPRPSLDNFTRTSVQSSAHKGLLGKSKMNTQPKYWMYILGRGTVAALCIQRMGESAVGLHLTTLCIGNLLRMSQQIVRG